MRIIIKDATPKEPEGERESLEKVTSGTLAWTPKGWEVDGDVRLFGKNLERIPYRFHRVGGFFDISVNKLTSLIGSPRFVGEDFYAYSNKLISLVGSPEEVGGDFYAHVNNLVSIGGISRKIGKGLYLSYNKPLTSLVGFPEEVGGNLYLWGASVPGIESVPGLKGNVIWR